MNRNLRHTAALILQAYFCGLLLLSNSVLAQEAPATPPKEADPETDLSQQITEAKADFRPLTESDVASAKQILNTKLTLLDAFLSRGTQENEDAWKTYFRWDELQSQLNSEKPDIATLEQIYQKFRGSYAGLDKPVTIEARQSLRSYIIALIFSAQGEQFKPQFEMQMDALASAVQGYTEQPNEEDAKTIGAALGWLNQADQVPDLVDQVRKVLDHPNLYVAVSKEFLASGIRRKVDQVNPVHEIILGTNVRGTAHMVGNVDVNLVPSEDRGKIELLLNGTVTSDNVGVNGPATIYSTGYSPITASKILVFTPEGLSAMGANATATTTTTFDAICAKLRLVQKIATKRAYQQKHHAEAIASDRTEARLEQRFDDESKDLVADANQRLNEKLYRHLKGRDEFPDTVNVSTTTDQLKLEVMHSAETQLAAPNEAPEIDDPTADLTLKLHESIINNYGETFLGGVKLTDERLVEILEERKAEVPEELKITPDTDPWSITFDYVSPIQVAFDNDTVKIGIRGRQFTRGNSEVNRIIAISADYKIEKTEAGTLLTRTGEVVVDFPNQEGLGAKDLTAKTFLRKKFESVFKQEIVGEGIKLDGQWEKAGTLRISNLSVTPGWFVGTWKLEAPTEAPAEKATPTEVTSVVE